VSRATRVVLMSAAAAAATTAAAVVLKQRQFQQATGEDVHALFSEAGPSVGAADLKARGPALPAPVRRHLEYAITATAPAIRTARLRHTGTFRTGPDQGWSPIEGEQYFSVANPGFVWFARMRLMPLLWIQARDRLLSGRGNMLVKPMSAFAIADASGPEIDQGAMLRWLAESVWFPYAFVSDAIEWQPIDGRSARASMRCPGAPVQAVFEMDQEGRIVALQAARYRDVGGGRSVLTPWSGRYADFLEFGGFRVPSAVEVTWNLADGPFTYARFRITALEYNVAGPF
jgi:uncharacterized protein DUF6544